MGKEREKNLVISIEKRLNLSEAQTAAEGTRAAAIESVDHVCLRWHDCCTLQRKMFYMQNVYLPFIRAEKSFSACKNG